MVALLLTTTINCAQAITILNNLQSVVGLSNQQKVEIYLEIKKVIPSCPIIIEKPKTKK